MTVKELMNFCKENNLPSDTKIIVIGCDVKYVGYSNKLNVLAIEESDELDTDAFDVVRECNRNI